jgi:hypothetical protein
LPSIQEQDMWFGVFYVVQYVTDLLLNIKEPFIYQLVAVLADQMGEFSWNQKTTRFSDKCNSGRRNFFCVHWIKGYSC